MTDRETTPSTDTEAVATGEQGAQVATIVDDTAQDHAAQDHSAQDDSAVAEDSGTAAVEQGEAEQAEAAVEATPPAVADQEKLKAPAPVPVASTDPTKWGRVDAEGTVYVNTADGERSVGSWQAGEPEEGLAHYARRFDDIRTEVELLEARIVSGAGDPKQSLTSAKHIKESLVEAAVVGDLVALNARVEFVLAHAKQAIEAAKQAREVARGASVARKQELVEEAEQLSESDDWGVTAGRYKALMTEWKAAGRAPKDSDDALWQRFRAAQDKFFARRSSAFNERDAEFTDNAKAKEELLAEAEKINPTSGDLDAARAHLHRIQERWEQVGKVPRERVRELEGRLRAVEEKVRNAADQQWRRTDPEAQARAAQFRERVEEFESKAAKARAAGDARRAEQAEAQAAQWREWLAAAEQAVATR